jgi:hypothetical protein
MFETVNEHKWHVIDGNPGGSIWYDLDSANVTSRRVVALQHQGVCVCARASVLWLPLR